MILASVVLKGYCIIILSTCLDEIWNIKNPRPYPKVKYHTIQWEEKDFYTFKVNGKWLLRKYRKTDTKFKRKVRNEYWKKRNNLQGMRNEKK